MMGIGWLNILTLNRNILVTNKDEEGIYDAFARYGICSNIYV